jgi:hypothetical protein
MDYFAGLDVSVEETSVCIVDDTGRIDVAADFLRLTITTHFGVPFRRENSRSAKWD